MAGRLLSVLSLLALALAVGCGGEGDTSASGGDASAFQVTTSSLSKAQFLKKANAICARGLQEALTFQPSGGGGQRAEEQVFAEAIEASIVPALERTIAEIHALGAPAGDERQLEEFLTSFQAGVEGLEQRRGSISSFDELSDPLLDAGRKARDYGLQNCGFR